MRVSVKLRQKNQYHVLRDISNRCSLLYIQWVFLKMITFNFTNCEPKRSWNCGRTIQQKSNIIFALCNTFDVNIYFWNFEIISSLHRWFASDELAYNDGITVLVSIKLFNRNHQISKNLLSMKLLVTANNKMCSCSNHAQAMDVSRTLCKFKGFSRIFVILSCRNLTLNDEFIWFQTNYKSNSPIGLVNCDIEQMLH